ncbi:MAG TPA: type II secretion system F family protein [Phycisphaerae bacterium]|nr:type II secretion system F family protein [Phycisphaerae bacterium]HRW55828.1 type II secretion system F family protein [Phycisphaerae bacterium]
MPKFQYEAMDAQGKEVKDEVEAPNSEEAVAKIRAQGYFPTKVKQKGGQKKAAAATLPGQRRKAVSVGRVGQKQLTQFTRQLSTLMDAGLPILRSLRILEQQQKPGPLRVALRTVAEDVEGGMTLSEAMSAHPKVFDRLYCNMIAAGEAGGVLDVILQRLAEFMEKAQKLKRKVIGAMIYPVAVLTFAFMIVAGIMVFVVPKFKAIFDDFDTTLPGPTVLLMGMSEWMIGNTTNAAGETVPMAIPGWAYIVFSPVIFLTLWKLIRKFEGGRYALDLVKLKIPILGNILTKTAIARFTRTLGTLISAGVPILEALNITKDTSGNEVYVRAMARVHDSIREGESFAEPLRASKVVDSLVVNMVDVGEETGDLDKMLIKVADNYDDEVETLVASLVSMLEPVMVIVLGLIVGFIVIALFLPMVSLVNSLTGG